MGEMVKQILTRPVQLADQVSKAADEAVHFRAECLELKAKTTKLAELLRQTARTNTDLYERPTRRIMDETEQSLEKALALVDKCRTRSLIRRIFPIVPSGALRRMISQLESSIGDVSWLLRVSGRNEDDVGCLGLPPIATNEPTLCMVWEQIANLSCGSLEERSDTAASLVSSARDNDRYTKLIIEEGGVAPLLKLAKEGNVEGQENASRAIGMLGRDEESVEEIVNAGVCSVFAKLLKDGCMRVQVEVARSVSVLAANYPNCQDHFAQNNVIRLLVSHLAFETIPEHSKYAITNRNKQMSTIHSVVVASNQPDQRPSSFEESPFPRGIHNVVNDTMERKSQQQQSSARTSTSSSSSSISNQHQIQLHQPSQHHPHHVLAGSSIKGREFEDPATKAQMKVMAARALWHLCKGNVSICRSICESRALLCFAVLLEKGPYEIQYPSCMALMEITAVAELNPDLRRNAFKPTAPAAKAVVDQMLKIVIETRIDLLAPCVRSLGHLARTFRRSETRMLGPLVRLIDADCTSGGRGTDILLEAVVALLKFACEENFLHIQHSQAILQEGAAEHFYRLVFVEDEIVKIPSLILACYIALHVPESPALAKHEVRNVLEQASKQAYYMSDPEVEEILPRAKSRLELYQPRGVH